MIFEIPTILNCRNVKMRLKSNLRTLLFHVDISLGLVDIRPSLCPKPSKCENANEINSSNVVVSCRYFVRTRYLDVDISIFNILTIQHLRNVRMQRKSNHRKSIFLVNISFELVDIRNSLYTKPSECENANKI